MRDPERAASILDGLPELVVGHDHPAATVRTPVGQHIGLVGIQRVGSADMAVDVDNHQTAVSLARSSGA